MYSLSLTLGTDAEYVSMTLNESFDSRGRKIIKTTRPYYRLAQGYNYCLVMGLESGTRAFFCVRKIWIETKAVSVFALYLRVED